MFVGTIFMIFN